MKKMFHTTARIGLAIGILCLAGASTGYLTMSSFRRHAATASGTVIDMVSYHNGGDLTYAPVVTYYDKKRKRHTYISHAYATPAAYTIGEGVYVFYNPQHPEEAQLVPFNTHTGLMVLLVVGLLAGGMGIGLLYYRRSASHPQNWLLPNGRSVAVEFIKMKK
ncbi:DUF3592 domain-containing protein [Chitinophaga costaii]|nr:DUF3592 domain-containing protein [Chitinophaga costaii]